jgi:mannose-6-phosphate isomerase-like protein (cupin superfamily)
MEAKSFFDGRATVKSLLVTDRPADRAEICARLSSPRGELAVLTDGSTPIRHLCYVELRTGKVRGNHFHKLRHEYFYVIAGNLAVQLQDLSTMESASVELREGDMLYIKPGVAHALNPLKDGHALEYAAEAFDLADVYPQPLI